MTHAEMMRIVQAQLAVDLNCSVADLNRERDSLVFVEANDNPGRRPYPRKARHFDIVSMGGSIVVSATPERLAIARTHMTGKGRDAIFALPFIRGPYLHFLPDPVAMEPVPAPSGFAFAMLEGGEVRELLAAQGFTNSLIYDPSHPYQTVLAMIAKEAGSAVAVAGASDVCTLWRQVGVDVLPGYRKLGLASYLLSKLTTRILSWEFVPVYSTIASNIASQRVARRAGYYPAWISDWRCDFAGLESSADCTAT